jgi:hypothetical protein
MVAMQKKWCMWFQPNEEDPAIIQEIWVVPEKLFPGLVPK